VLKPLQNHQIPEQQNRHTLDPLRIKNRAILQVEVLIQIETLTDRHLHQVEDLDN
jgi:hypothetical protein